MRHVGCWQVLITTIAWSHDRPNFFNIVGKSKHKFLYVGQSPMGKVSYPIFRKKILVLLTFTLKVQVISTRALNSTTPNVWKAGFGCVYRTTLLRILRFRNPFDWVCTYLYCLVFGLYFGRRWKLKSPWKFWFLNRGVLFLRSCHIWYISSLHWSQQNPLILHIVYAYSSVLIFAYIYGFYCEQFYKNVQTIYKYFSTTTLQEQESYDMLCWESRRNLAYFFLNDWQIKWIFCSNFCTFISL